MKKILSITMLIIYLFSINTLVHASTMGFFSHTNNNVGHCHEQQSSSQNKTPNIDCCELAFSNQYSNTQITPEYTSHSQNIIPYFDCLIKISHTPNMYIQDVAWSPGRNPDIKYNKFSDLFGIIVSLS